MTELIMSSSTLVHSSPCLPTEICKRFRVSASSDDERRRRKKIRRTHPNIPDDVIPEILLRVPAKELHQFKGVCKSWHNLICSQPFISSHYAIHKANLVSLCCDSNSRPRSETMTFLFSDVPVDLAPVTCELPKIVGCAYGVVCFSLYDCDTRFLLWNPAIGCCRIVSLRGPPAPRVYAGFCFDSVSNTHKVVRISIPWIHRRQTFVTQTRGVVVRSYTLNTRSVEMKKLDAVPFKIPLAGEDIGEVTCVGIFMFWVLKPSDDDDKCLLCFNMVDESFRLIEFPCIEHSRPSTVLAEYKGSLAMFVWNAGSFDVWLLLNDDCRYSWSKKLSLTPPLPDIRFPIGFFLKGKVESVLVYTGSGYFLWNTASGEATKVFSDKAYIRQLFHYSPSLASVHPKGSLTNCALSYRNGNSYFFYFPK